MSMQTQTQNAVWTIDPAHSNVEFTVRHLMISTVRGRFGEVEGTIKGDPEHLERGGRFEAKIETGSVDTRDEKRDTHLRSADFFDVESHPQMTYVSRAITAKSKPGEYTAEGDLTIRGVTRPVTLNVTFNGRVQDPWGGERIALSATGAIDRTEYGLTWNTPLANGGVMVSEKVQLHIEAQAALQA